MNILKGSKNYFGIILILFIGILLLNSNSFAQSPDDLMNQGNRFYQSGQYENALEVYHKVLSQGYESAALYYNLGNAYFKTNKLGYAVLYYEKGLKLSPGDEDILYNLKIANARTVDQITEVPKLFIIQWWKLLITELSVPGWSLVTIIVYLIFILSIGMYLLSKRMKIQRWAFMSGSAEPFKAIPNSRDLLIFSSSSALVFITFDGMQPQ